MTCLLFRCATPLSQSGATRKDSNEDEESEEDDGDVEESYDNLEGAYNARDYQQLNVSVEVRDLFQYIERYKPHEVQLEAPLRCFIPEYIPAIGELDAFIKVRHILTFYSHVVPMIKRESNSWSQWVEVPVATAAVFTSEFFN